MQTHYVKQQIPGPGHPLWRGLLLMALLLMALLPGGCSWFGGGDAESTGDKPAGDAAAQQEERIIEGGLLDTIFDQAPPGSVAQYLARIAGQLGWEPQVAQNTLLKNAISDGAWEDKVEPMLLGLFYGNGFSVLPSVGENHQFGRDSIVRGAVKSTRLLVTNRHPIRIIFLRPVANLELVYHQDGEQPQVFALSSAAVIAVRRSQLAQYLR